MMLGGEVGAWGAGGREEERGGEEPRMGAGREVVEWVGMNSPAPETASRAVRKRISATPAFVRCLVSRERISSGENLGEIVVGFEKEEGSSVPVGSRNNVTCSCLWRSKSCTACEVVTSLRFLGGGEGERDVKIFRTGRYVCREAPEMGKYTV